MESDSRIRPAGAADLGSLAELMTASPLLQRYGTTRAAALAALEEGMRQGDVLLVEGVEHQPPRGFGWVLRLRGFGGAGYVRLLLVAENQQGTGIGERLLRRAEQHAATWSRHLLLLASEDNPRARRFYERRGYRQVGQVERLMLPDTDEVIYHKILPM